MTLDAPSMREVMLAYERVWNCDGRTYVRLVNHLWQRWQKWTGDEAVAAHIGALFSPLQLSHSEPILTSRTLREAARNTIEFYNALNIHSRFGVDAQPDRFAITVSYPRDLGLMPFDAEWRLSVITHLIRWFSPEAGAVRAVHFHAPRPAYDGELIRVLGCAVLFDQPVNAVIIEPRAMETPIWGSECVRSKLVRFFAAADLKMDVSRANLRELVARTIRSCLEEHGCGIKCVAPKLGMSPRTLQRRLANEGTHFSEVLDQVRMQSCTHLMREPDMQLREMARQLGYSNESNFQHAFRRWFGTTPGHYRFLQGDRGLQSFPSPLQTEREPGAVLSDRASFDTMRSFGKERRIKEHGVHELGVHERRIHERRVLERRVLSDGLAARPA